MSRLWVFALLAVGCGSSDEPQQHPPPDVGVAEPYEAGTTAPKRTMRSSPLFGETTIDNLLIDPTFEEGGPGIGRWYSNSGISTLNANGPRIGQRILSASPIGIALPVARVFDITDEGKTRAFSLLAQVPGGVGPYVVSMWLSTERPLEAPLGDTVRVGVANAGASGGITAVEVTVDESLTRTIAGRTWLRFRGEVPGPYPIGAFMTIRFKGSRNVWYLQAPEVVPKALLAPAQTMSLKLARPMDLDAEERAGIAAYQRIPLDYGVRNAPSPTRDR